MPFARVVEEWFCARIEAAQWGEEIGKLAKQNWEEARTAADPALEVVAFQGMATWAVSGARAKLGGLAERLAKVKPDVEAEPEAELAQPKAEPSIIDQVVREPTPRAVRPEILLPGVAGDLQDHYLRTAMQTSAILSVIPGLVLPTVLACENVIGPSGPNGCVLQQIIVGLAPTGGGKQTVIALIKRTLAALKATKLLGPSRFKSGNAVIKHVKEHPVSLCIQDEFGAFLMKLGNPRSAPCEFEINERFREFYSLEPGEPYTSPEGMSEDSELIENPHLNILGMGNRDEFFGACQATDIVNGFLNRMTAIEEPNLIKPRTNFEVRELPFSVFDKLMKITNLKPMRLAWGPGAREVFEAQQEWVFAQEDDRQRKLWVRSPEKLVRIASGFAVSRLDTRVLQSDMDVAKAIMDRSDRMFQDGIDEAETKRELTHAQLRLEIERRLRARAAEDWGSLAELKKAFKNNTKYKKALDEALDDMYNSGTLRIERVTTKGRHKDVYRLVED
jgi:hypothetical protein